MSIHDGHVTSEVPTEVQAAWLHHRFTQIHPFQDGNGRVARAITSLVLVKDGLFPFVVTREDKPTYLNALEAADDGNLSPLVGIIVKLQRVQFAKATSVSEFVLSKDADVKEILSKLLSSTEKTVAERMQNLTTVFTRADEIRVDIAERLQEIIPEITTALLRFSSVGNAAVNLSTSETEHYYRSQIIENAQRHLHYYFNSSDFRSWIALNLTWTRRARLVFTIHGIGQQFSGSLICAPFLEFIDRDADSQTQTTVVPVANEGFVFFYNESKDQILKRFQLWRENVLKIALQELIQNL